MRYTGPWKPRLSSFSAWHVFQCWERGSQFLLFGNSPKLQSSARLAQTVLPAWLEQGMTSHKNIMEIYENHRTSIKPIECPEQSLVLLWLDLPPEWAWVTWLRQITVCLRLIRSFDFPMFFRDFGCHGGVVQWLNANPVVAGLSSLEF